MTTTAQVLAGTDLEASLTGYLDGSNNIVLVTSGNPLPVTVSTSVTTASVSKSTRAAITPSGQADTSINAGECIGTLQTVTGVLETGIESGILTSIDASFDTQQTGILDAYLFNANPTSSTITDGSPFVLAAADLPKFMGMFPLAPIGQLGTSGVTTTYDSGPLYRAIAGTTSGVLYVVLVAETAMTLTSGDWLSLRIGAIRD